MNRKSIVSLPGLSEIIVGTHSESASLRRNRRLVRRLGIETLESRMLLNAAPVLTIDQTDYDITTNSPWYIALSSTDADNDAVYYQVEVLEGDLTCELSVGTQYNASGTQAEVSTRNPLWQLTVNQSGGVEGTMLFELFKDRVPNTVSQIMSLTTQNSYDGITFHRIIEDFMSQGGATYADGSAINGTYYQIDDEFDWNLRHTSDGVLSMAKSSDDSNTSQFFITAERCSWLDFQHSVFGFILDGQEVNSALNKVDTAGGSTPVTTVTLSDAELVVNKTFSTLMVRAASEGSGTGKIKVTAFDANGNQCAESKTLSINITAEGANSLPYNPYMNLDKITGIEVTKGETHSFIVPVTDYLGHTYSNVSAAYGAYLYATGGTTPLENAVTCGSSTGSVKIDASSLSVGVYELDLLVTNSGQNWTYSSGGSTIDLSDRQTIPVYVTPTKLTGISLLSTDDTGTSDSDGITGKSSNLTFVVEGCSQGMTIQLYNPQSGDDQLMGEAVCVDDSGTVNITVSGSFGDGTYNLYAIQVLKNQTVSAGNTVGTVDLASDNSESFTLVVNSAELTFDNLADYVSDTSVYRIEPGAAWTLDVKTNQEEKETPVTYRLENAPEGMTINSSTGAIAWTPTASQAAIHTFTLFASDVLGHEISQEIKLNVSNSDNVSSPVIPDSIPYTVDQGDSAPTSGTLVRTDSGTSQALIPEHSDLTINFSATDEDGDPISWSISSASSDLVGLAIDSNGVLTWTAGEANGGSTYKVTVMATDGRGGYDTFAFEIGVSEMLDPPVFSAANAQLTAPGQDLSFKVSATDPDASATISGSAVFYELTGDFTENVRCNSKTGEVVWSVPQDCAPGVYSIQIKATKAAMSGGQKLESTQTVTVYVLEQAAYNGLVQQGTLALSLWSDTDSGSSNSDGYTKFNNSSNDLSLKILAENLTPRRDLVLFCDGKVYARDTAEVASLTLYFGDSGTVSASDFSTLTDGNHSFTIAQIIPDQTVSFSLNGTEYADVVVDLPTQISEPLDITIDTEGPAFDDQYWTPVVNLLEGIAYSDTVQTVDNLSPLNDIRYSLTSAPSGMTINAQTGEISWTPNLEVEENMSYTVCATDLAGNSSTKTVNMSVVLAPKLTIEDQTIAEEVEWVQELNAEGATAYQLISAPEGLYANYNPETGTWTLNWTPTDEQGNDSSYTVKVQAYNEQGANSTIEFNLTVSEVNKPPVIGTVADKLFCSEGELFELLLNATDNDYPVQDLSWSLTSAPEGMAIDAATGSLTWTPTEAMGGKTISVTVNVSDGVDTTSQELFFEVSEVDDMPVFGPVALPTVFKAAPGMILPGTAVSLQFNAQDPDYETEPDVPINAVEYELILGPEGAVIDPQTGLLSWSVAEDQELGSYSFIVRAAEILADASGEGDSGEGSSQGLSAEYSFDLVVVPALEMAAVDGQTVLEGQEISVQPEANIDNTTERPLKWSIANAPDGMSIDSNTGRISWTPGELQGGNDYSFTVTVTDESGSASQTVVYKCQEVDSAPVFATPQLPTNYGTAGVVVPGASVEIQMQAADPDVPANSIVYELVDGPEGCAIDETTGLLTWRVPDTYANSDVNITVKATELASGDGSLSSIGLSTEVSFHLGVVGIPAPVDRFEFSFVPYRPQSAMERAAKHALEQPPMSAPLDVLMDISARFLKSYQDEVLIKALSDSNDSPIFGIQYGPASHGEIAPPVTEESAEDGKKKDSAEQQQKKESSQQGPSESRPDSSQKKDSGEQQTRKERKRPENPKSILH